MPDKMTQAWKNQKQTKKLLHLHRLAPVLFVILGLLYVRPVLAQEPTVADQLYSLAHVAKEGMEAAEHNNTALMQAEYNELHELWGSFEDAVRDQNPTAYIELEGALAAVKTALQAEPFDPLAVQIAYDHLMGEANEIATDFGGTQVDPPAVIEATPTDLMTSLNAAYTAVEAGDADGAAEELAFVTQAWPSVEGAIAAKSPDAYTAIEVDLSRAASALNAQPVDLSGAKVALERLRESLSPFVNVQTYTMLDAAAIILREGLEALLVIVALLAFLQRSGNSDKRNWIWGGGLLGILASIVTAFLLHAVFSYASSGQNREVIEGATSLVAAGLLFYVSYWLHSKANLGAWQKYINSRTSQALAQGSVAGLASLSFLAVFREGAETTVFYLGMASSIALIDLLLGLGLGIAILVMAAFLILKLGLRLPLRPFFLVAGVLVYYLGFKFVGSGIHALQVGGVLPASLIDFVPVVPFIGLYPTWETVGLQLLLLIGAVAAILYLRAQNRRAQSTGTAITA